jgi:hypothetical protein
VSAERLCCFPLLKSVEDLRNTDDIGPCALRAADSDQLGAVFNPDAVHRPSTLRREVRVCFEPRVISRGLGVTPFDAVHRCSKVRLWRNQWPAAIRSRVPKEDGPRAKPPPHVQVLNPPFRARVSGNSKSDVRIWGVAPPGCASNLRGFACLPPNIKKIDQLIRWLNIQKVIVGGSWAKGGQIKSGTRAKIVSGTSPQSSAKRALLREDHSGLGQAVTPNCASCRKRCDILL